MENKFTEWLKLVDQAGTERDPEVLKFFIKYQKDIIQGARDYKPPKEYKYMITFTVDPKKIQAGTIEIQNDIESYIKKLLDKPDNSRFYYAKEHADSNVHWHCVVHRSKHIIYDKFKYYRKQYGNVDISKSFDLSDEHTEKYLGKENKIIYIK